MTMHNICVSGRCYVYKSGAKQEFSGWWVGKIFAFTVIGHVNLQFCFCLFCSHVSPRPNLFIITIVQENIKACSLLQFVCFHINEIHMFMHQVLNQIREPDE